MTNFALFFVLIFVFGWLQETLVLFFAFLFFAITVLWVLQVLWALWGVREMHYWPSSLPVLHRSHLYPRVLGSARVSGLSRKMPLSFFFFLNTTYTSKIQIKISHCCQLSRECFLCRSWTRLHQVLVNPSPEDLYFYGNMKLAKFHVLTPQKSDSIVLKTTKTACVTYV